MPACDERASILCARLIRGTRSRLKALTFCFASALTASALAAGCRKLISTAPALRRPTSSGVGGCTLSTASLPRAVAASVTLAPTSMYAASLKKAEVPAPASIETCRPALTSPRAASGTSATRRSPARLSFGTPIFIMPAGLYGLSGLVSVEQRAGRRHLAGEFGHVEVHSLAGEQPVADGEEDHDAIAKLAATRLDSEERPIHPAEDFRLLDDAVLGVDPVQQRQLDVRDAVPEPTIELAHLILAPPALAERYDFVLAVLVQGRDQPFQLASVLGARVLDPELVIGLGDGTLRPGLEWAASQPGLRHIRRIGHGPLLGWNAFWLSTASR